MKIWNIERRFQKALSVEVIQKLSLTYHSEYVCMHV
jgi:hypothetical protein